MSDKATLAISAHGGYADGVKLRNAPGRRLGGGGGNARERFAGLELGVDLQSVTVDIIGDIFRDIPGDPARC